MTNILSILIFLFILGVLIIVHEFGHFIAARRVGVRVEKFYFGFGPELFKYKLGNTEYGISALPLGGFVKLAGDSAEEFKGKDDEYLAKSPGQRFRIIFCGPLVNYVLGFLFFCLIFFVGYPTFTTKVGGLLDGYGAKSAGLVVGDKIVAVDGGKVDSWEEMQKRIQLRRDASKVSLSIVRDNREFNAEVLIKDSDTEVMTQDGKRRLGIIGISPADEMITVKHGLLQSFVLGAKKTLDLSVMTFKGLWWLATGKISMRDSMTGPLGIFFITSKAASLGIIAILHLMAVLSISLAIFNLLPLPVLDGGHILFLAIEKIRGKPLSIRIEQIAQRTGLVLIVGLALIVTYNDILRLFGDKISGVFK
ncbi:MAG: RIP metalloprotease RseP [Candidatus Omnitrophota bacterium]|nr:RIP metalloprotease RseP [Candidatus Omnitrophota bacterium]